MARTPITIEFAFETDEGNEVVVVATAYATPISRAVIHPVDRSHPEEGGDIEDIELKWNGVALDLDVAEEMGLDKEELEDALYEAYCDQDDGWDEE